MMTSPKRDSQEHALRCVLTGRETRQWSWW